jgi:hypothetical protein
MLWFILLNGKAEAGNDQTTVVQQAAPFRPYTYMTTRSLYYPKYGILDSKWSEYGNVKKDSTAKLYYKQNSTDRLLFFQAY